MSERPPLLFYCQHTLGMGHLVRSLTLARALATHFRVVLLNGGPVPAGLARPREIEFVDLPPLGLTEDGRLVTRSRRWSVAEAQEARRTTILSIWNALQPKIIVLELFPFGRKKFASELLPMLDAARDLGRHRPLVVSSLRDILVTGRADQQSHDDRVCALANRHLDAILVHADASFARLEESFRPREPLQVPVHYTGFVTAVRPRPSAGGTPRIVVSAGGGRVGGPLLEAAVEAHALLWRTEQLPMTIVGGPFVPRSVWRALQTRAHDLVGLELRRVVPELGQYLTTASASVSQCGYNTAVELLTARVPALVVPFGTRHDDEQRVRAHRLAALGAVRVLAPERLSGTSLAQEIRTLVHDATPRPITLAMDGALRTTELLGRLSQQRVPRRHESPVDTPTGTVP